MYLLEIPQLPKFRSLVFIDLWILCISYMGERDKAPAPDTEAAKYFSYKKEA